ncbi:hypothetical protein K1T71_006436 [Dendrolimus kikuchii]|uniref:Uncharacterized protein n=1 Tax=Dendrolimus kikuchii TaxID=765133 RepID=A0ACC1D0V5_9NEOP|nr:hypothetical protein K1T71_006436 [Dendrolimus kikuchii]
MDKALVVGPSPRGAGRVNERRRRGRQYAGGSGLRRLCPRSPLIENSECCANACVFMAVTLLRVLVLGVFAAAADEIKVACLGEAGEGVVSARAPGGAAACAQQGQGPAGRRRRTAAGLRAGRGTTTHAGLTDVYFAKLSKAGITLQCYGVRRRTLFW